MANCKECEVPFTPDAKEPFVESVEMELAEIYRLISELIETAKPSSASSYEVDNMALRALIHAVQQEDCIQ